MNYTYIAAAQSCYKANWAGAKDGERSRTRALAFIPDELHLHPVAAPCNQSKAIENRDRLVSRGLSTGTVNRHTAAFCTVWRHAYLNGWVPIAPPSGLYLKEKGGRVRVVAEDELKAMLFYLTGEEQGGIDGPGSQPGAGSRTRVRSYGYGPLVRFLYETGCRVGEALKLKPRDINFMGRQVTFRDCKNGSDRTVPLTNLAYQALEYSLYANGPFAWASQSALNHHWTAAKNQMALGGDTEFVPHSLRHSYASRLVVAGVPLPVVAALLGHKSIKTTLKYTHISLQNSVDALTKAGIL